MKTLKSKLWRVLPLGLGAAALITILVVAVVMFTGRDPAPENETPQETETTVESGKTALTMKTLPKIPYVDIAEVYEFRDVLRYAYHYGYLNGVTKYNFAPLEGASRAAAITVLYRLSGETAPAYDGRFSDVVPGIWYQDAVAWGVASGITSGTSDRMFSPDSPVTRSQLATMLYRFAAYMGYNVAADGNLSAYTDGSAVPAYAAKPLDWGLERGLFRAAISDTILPYLPVSRLQLATAVVALRGVMGDKLAAQIISELPEKEKTELPYDTEAAQLTVETIAEKYGAIGVQVAVVRNGAVVDTYTHGWATLETELMSDDHKLCVGPASQLAVGLAAMILLEDGVVDLDEKIGKYWGFNTINPYYKKVPVTIRSLLTHTSSMIDAGEDGSRAYDSVVLKLRNYYYNKQRPGAQTSWNYNEFAFDVLGMTLEQASGKHLTKLLRSQLFDAMGIDGAFYPGEMKNTDLLATLYHDDGSVAQYVAVQKEMKNSALPGESGDRFSDGLTISAVDLAKLVALLGADGVYEGVRILDENSVAMMELMFPVSEGFSQAMPLRWCSDLFGREGIFYQTGNVDGVCSSVSYDPATGDGVVVLATGAADSEGENNICSEIASYFYEEIKEQRSENAEKEIR